MQHLMKISGKNEKKKTLNVREKIRKESIHNPTLSFELLLMENVFSLVVVFVVFKINYRIN